MVNYKNIYVFVFPFFIISSCFTERKTIQLNEQEITPLSPEQVIEADADYCHNQKDYPCALHLYTKLIEEFADSAIFYYKRSITYKKMDNFSKAIDDLNRAINTSDSSNFIYYFERGYIYFQEQNFSKAETDFNLASSLNDTCATCYYFLGLSQSNQYESDLAVNNITKAIELNPYRSNYYVDLGFEYIKQNNTSLALNVLNKGISIDSTDYMLFFTRGIIYYEKGLFQVGDNDILYSLKLNLKSIEFALKQTRQYMLANNLSISERILSLVSKVYPDIAEIYVERARISVYQRNYLNAITMYKKALELNPENFNWLNQKAKLEMQEQKYMDAFEDYSKLILMQPKNSELYIKRGYASYKLNNKIDARNDWEKALKLNNYSAQEYLDTYLK